MKRKPSAGQSAGIVTTVLLLAALRAGAGPLVPATFTALGPTGIIVSGPNGPWAGAIESLVAHPTNPDILWIGSVNGGVWKTTNATDKNPHWVPLTDQKASLSIGALALDPTDPSMNTLVAGIGHASSFNGRGGPLVGLLRTADGGGHWTPIGSADLSGKSITGVAPRGTAIVVSTKSGIWRSDDGGATFRHLGHNRGLVQQSATDLAADPSNLDVLYTGITGTGGGVFRSDDGGIHWINVSGNRFGQPGGHNLVTEAKRIRLSVHDDGKVDVVYAGIIGPDRNPSGIFRSVDRGATWTALDIPPIEQAAQGRLSIVADPRFPDLFYLGGDERGPDEGDETPGGKPGPIYRCDASRPSGGQCTSMSGIGTADGSFTHADSRQMQFDANGDLLETDDGGIFRNPRPRSESGSWVAINGDLSITETHSCAWDHVKHVAICGTQDNGTGVQPERGAAVWKQVHPGDGGDVAVFNSTDLSIQYFSAQRLGKFTREACLGAFCETTEPALKVFIQPLDVFDFTLPDFKGPHPAAIATHPQHPTRLVIVTGFVYESVDSGHSLTPLNGFSGESTRSIAYGSTTKDDVLYVGSSEGLFLHTAKFGSMERLAAYPGGPPAGIALDPADWQSAWVVDSKSVLHTSNHGSKWHDMTGNLTKDASDDGAGAQELFAIAFVPRPSGSLVFVGASDGLYVMSTTDPKRWNKLSGKLPNVLVYDLRFDVEDDILLVSTVGRGAWKIENPGSIQLP